MSDEIKNERFEMYAKHAKDNELEIIQSDLCGCYFCRHIFSAREVSDWVEDEHHVSAVCPECGMDTVIGDHSGVPISKDLLKEMNDYFYGQADGRDTDSAVRFCARYIAGKITHKEKNEKLYRDYLESLYIRGNEQATLELASLVESGGDFGIPDPASAEKLYLSSNLKLNSDAMCRLASLYLRNEDETVRAKAFPLAAKATALGDPVGIYLISDCLLGGVGVEQSIDQAYAVIDRAYQDFFPCLIEDDDRELMGFANFAYRLGKFNQYGVGTERDVDAALKLYLFAKLACLNAKELGYGDNPILPDIEKEIKGLSESEKILAGDPIFDANMFFDSFSYVQDSASKKELSIIDYDEKSGELTLDINFVRPVALIDTGTLSCLMRVGVTRWVFSGVAFFQGKSGEYNRVGSNDGESWVFFNGEEEVAKLRFRNGGTDNAEDVNE